MWWDTQATPQGVFGVPEDDYQLFTDRQTEFILDTLEPWKNDRIGDIGCGIGRLLAAMRSRQSDLQLVGVDPSPRMLAQAALVAPPLTLIRNEDGREIHGMPRLNGAYSVLTFQHVVDSTVALILSDVAEALWIRSKFVAQWLIGAPDNTGPMSYPRTVEQIESLLFTTGFSDVEFVPDWNVTRYSEEWVWTVAR